MTTRVLPLGRDWVEVVSALALVADTAYYIEAVDGPAELFVSARAASPGDGERGRPIWPGTPIRAPDARRYAPAAAEYLHARAFGARAALVVDEG